MAASVTKKTGKWTGAARRQLRTQDIAYLISHKLTFYKGNWTGPILLLERILNPAKQYFFA